METNPVKSKSLVNAVTDEIINQVKLGKLKPGDKLDSQRELAKKLDVGIGCVREAIQALNHSNIVEVKPGKGVFISDISIESLLNPIRVVVPLADVNKEKLIELWNARMAIERGAITEIIANIKKDELLELEEIFKNMSDLLEEKDIDSYNYEDLRFHSFLIKCTHNSILEQLYKFMNDLLTDIFKTKISDIDLAKKSFSFHKKIIEGIRKKDKEATDDALKNHIEISKFDIIKTFSINNKHKSR